VLACLFLARAEGQIHALSMAADAVQIGSIAAVCLLWSFWLLNGDYAKCRAGVKRRLKGVFTDIVS